MTVRRASPLGLARAKERDQEGYLATAKTAIDGPRPDPLSYQMSRCPAYE